MARAILIKQIVRRPKHQTRGIPLPTQQIGRVMIEQGQLPSKVARQVLTQIKEKTRRDGHNRQIELVEIREIAGGRHKIASKVLFRVFKSTSDGRLYVYEGASKRKERMGQPAGSVESNLVSVGV